MLDRYRCIAVVGGTGAVGLEALAILGERGVESARLRVLASERSAGSDVPYRGGSVRVAEIGPDSFRGVELALVCASAEVARRLAPVLPFPAIRLTRLFGALETRGSASHSDRRWLTRKPT